MTQTGVNVQRKSGQTLPEAYLKLVLDNNPTAWGASIVTENGIMIASGDDATIKLIQSTCNDFKDCDISFYFCNSTSAINMDDVSPFSLVEVADQPMVIASIVGEYPGFNQTASTHPSAFFFANHLTQKFKDLFELTDGNLDKIIAHVEKKSFKDELLLGSTDSGVTFTVANGKSTTVCLADTQKEYPWGWTSNHYGFEVDIAVGTGKKTSMFPSRSTVREKAPAAASASVPPVEQKPIEHPGGPPVTSASSTLLMNIGKVKAAALATWKRQDKKKWYQRYLGYAPRGFENCPEVEIYMDSKGNKMTKAEVDKLGLAKLELPPLQNPGREDGKDVEPNNIPQPDVSPSPPGVTDKVLPIMGPKAREWAKAFIATAEVKRIIAENGAVISDPAQTQQQEQMFQSFGLQLGEKDGFVSWLKLSFPMFMKVATERPEVMANFAWNMRNALASRMAREGKKLTAEETHVAGAQELKKTSLFPSKKAATG